MSNKKLIFFAIFLIFGLNSAFALGQVDGSSQGGSTVGVVACAILICPAGQTNVDSGQKTDSGCPVYVCKPSECLVTECGANPVTAIICPDGVSSPKYGCMRQIDGTCAWKVTTRCPSVCGNGICEDGEAGYCPTCTTSPCPATPCYQGTCPSDCKPKPVCGNGICEEGEGGGCPSVGDGPCWSGTCPQDCKPKPVCGNGICEESERQCSTVCYACDPILGEPNSCPTNPCKTTCTTSCPRDCTSKCTDSDGGANYYLKGTATSADGSSLTDECVKNNINGVLQNTGELRESVCDDSSPTFKKYITYKCPDTCNDGACTSETSVCGNGICETGEADESGCTDSIPGRCWTINGTCPTDCNRPKCQHENGFCGGFTARPLECCPGLTCKANGNYPDAGGICVNYQNCSSEGQTCGGNSANAKNCCSGFHCEIPAGSTADIGGTCISDAVTEVKVPSGFSLHQGQSVRVVNYKNLKITLNQIYQNPGPVSTTPQTGPVSATSNSNNFCCQVFSEETGTKYVWSTDKNCGNTAGLSCAGSCPTLTDITNCQKTDAEFPANYVSITVSVPEGDCGDPRKGCMLQGFSQDYKVQQGQTINAAGLKITFPGISRNPLTDSGTTQSDLAAYFKINLEGSCGNGICEDGEKQCFKVCPTCAQPVNGENFTCPPCKETCTYSCPQDCGGCQTAGESCGGFTQNPSKCCSGYHCEIPAGSPADVGGNCVKDQCSSEGQTCGGNSANAKNCCSGFHCEIPSGYPGDVGGTCVKDKKKCPAVNCPAPPEGCSYSCGRDENGCMTCGNIVCKDKCPLIDCPSPPPGCTYFKSQDQNGCPTCGSFVCASNTQVANASTTGPNGNGAQGPQLGTDAQRRSWICLHLGIFC